jgi:hypothetical protein
VKQHAAQFAAAQGLLGSGGKVNDELLASMPALRATGFDPFIQLGDATRGAQHQRHHGIGHGFGQYGGRSPQRRVCWAPAAK